MLLDLAMVAALLGIGNVAFRHFEPLLPLWRRLLKSTVILAVTAGISYLFGRTGVLIALGLAAVPLIYLHGFWLPGKGVNGWTGEPREKYHALRGWPPPEA